MDIDSMRASTTDHGVQSRMVPCWILLWAGFFVSALSCAAAPLEPGEYAGLRQRLSLLQNVTVDYEVTETHFPPPTLVQSAFAEKGLTFMSGTVKRDEGFAFLDGRAQYESRLRSSLTGGSSSPEAPARIVRSYALDRQEIMCVRNSVGPCEGTIRDAGALPMHSTVDLAIGLRLYKQEAWLGEEHLRNASVKHRSNGTIVLEFADPSSNGNVHRWTVDLATYGVLRYEMANSSDVVFDVIECSSFRDIAGVSLPFTIVRRTFGAPAEESGRLRLVQEKTIVPRQYLVGETSNSPDRYHITWPVGSRVLDERIGLAIQVRTGRQQLSDEAIYNAQVRRMSDSTVSRPAAVPATRAPLWIALSLVSCAIASLVAWWVWWSRRSLGSNRAT